MHILHKLIYELNRISIKIPVGVFKEMDNCILKFTWRSNFQSIETFGRPALPDFKISINTTAVGM